MRVAGIQTGRITGGSARIRYYTFMKYLKCDKTDNLEEADVIYFQKKSSKDIIKLARKLKHEGKKIVYDCDDGDGERDRKNRNDPAMFSIADAITTDTENRAKAFRKKTTTPVYVVQDCIDYGIKREDRIQIKPFINKTGTFGTHKVLESTYKFCKLFSILSGKEYITDRKIDKYEKSKWKLCLWNIDNFVEMIKKWDLCILAHPEDKTGSMKSNNRLIVCMALGIPTLVSYTYAYSYTMKAADLENWIVKKKVYHTFQRVKSEQARTECSNKMYEYAWNNYAPEKSVEQLESVFKSL
jgi:hypothetical protein